MQDGLYIWTRERGRRCGALYFGRLGTCLVWLGFGRETSLHLMLMATRFRYVTRYKNSRENLNNIALTTYVIGQGMVCYECQPKNVNNRYILIWVHHIIGERTYTGLYIVYRARTLFYQTLVSVHVQRTFISIKHIFFWNL
jgi:hypothetical protein